MHNKHYGNKYIHQNHYRTRNKINISNAHGRNQTHDPTPQSITKSSTNCATLPFSINYHLINLNNFSHVQPTLLSILIIFPKS